MAMAFPAFSLPVATFLVPAVPRMAYQQGSCRWRRMTLNKLCMKGTTAAGAALRQQVCVCKQTWQGVDAVEDDVSDLRCKTH